MNECKHIIGLCTDDLGKAELIGKNELNHISNIKKDEIFSLIIFKNNVRYHHEKNRSQTH